MGSSPIGSSLQRKVCPLIGQFVGSSNSYRSARPENHHLSNLRVQCSRLLPMMWDQRRTGSSRRDDEWTVLRLLVPTLACRKPMMAGTAGSWSSLLSTS